MNSGRGFPGQRISKKLIARVRPGVELVRASLVPTRELMTLDFPTFERPRNAISGTLGTGNCTTSVAAAINRDSTLMPKFPTACAKLARERQIFRMMRAVARRPAPTAEDTTPKNVQANRPDVHDAVARPLTRRAELH